MNEYVAAQFDQQFGEEYRKLIYRMDTARPDTKWLEVIETNISRLISTDQVEMEFKKNRQKVILDTISETS